MPMPFFQYIKNFIRFFQTLSRLSVFWFRQQQVVKGVLKPEIDAFQHDDTFRLEHRKRILNYASLVPVMLGEGYCLLFGRKMRDSERLTLTYLSAFVPLLDDLYDHFQQDDQRIESLIFAPSEFQPQSTFEQLALRIVSQLHHLAGNTAWQPLAIRLLKAQIESRKQRQNDLTSDQIRAIILEKGGVSSLIIRIFLEEPLNKTEENAVWLLGAIGQYEDDIFDLREDLASDTRTLITTADDIRLVFNDFQAQVQRTLQAFGVTNFKRQDIQRFQAAIRLFFMLGIVALKQLQRVQLEYGGNFTPKKYQRPEIVCDMELWKNRFVLMKEYVFWNYELLGHA